MDILLRIVAALVWAGILFLIFVLWRIARFYERSSGQSVYSWLFFLIFMLFLIGAVWYIIADPLFVGVPPADGLLCAGGSLSLLGTLILTRAMMRKP
ncbi:MAG: hypothetical protein RML46_05945 [Anaerolineae bacterium]|nr:hypothetical protein [Anaerolineae bacterium]MDW8068434.1 hypothetical protein [Anaerolineae bacterium]